MRPASPRTFLRATELCRQVGHRPLGQVVDSGHEGHAMALWGKGEQVPSSLLKRVGPQIVLAEDKALPQKTGRLWSPSPPPNPRHSLPPPKGLSEQERGEVTLNGKDLRREGQGPARPEQSGFHSLLAQAPLLEESRRKKKRLLGPEQAPQLRAQREKGEDPENAIPSLPQASVAGMNCILHQPPGLSTPSPPRPSQTQQNWTCRLGLASWAQEGRKRKSGRLGECPAPCRGTRTGQELTHRRWRVRKPRGEQKSSANYRRRGSLPLASAGRDLENHPHEAVAQHLPPLAHF
jgi:hypothetical protein